MISGNVAGNHHGSCRRGEGRIAARRRAAVIALGHRLTHAFESGLGPIPQIAGRSRPDAPGTGEGETRIEREPGLDRGMRLVQSTKLRQEEASEKWAVEKFRLASIDRREATNAPVRVLWFSDRIEVWSPGGPFGIATREISADPASSTGRSDAPWISSRSS